MMTARAKILEDIQVGTSSGTRVGPSNGVCKRILPSAGWLKVLTVFTPGCKTNTQIQAFLQERRCYVVVYLRYGVTALAREAIAIVLFTSGSKTNTHIQAFLQARRCCGGVYL